jgi:hypothetical protein
VNNLLRTYERIATRPASRRRGWRSLLERCKRSPRLETIVILAKALGLASSAELLEGVR